MDFATGDHIRLANVGNGFDGHAVFFEAKATARQNFFVTAGVQVGEAVRELDVFAVGGDGAEGALAFFQFTGGYVVDVNGEEPAHAGAFVFQIACGFGGAAQVNGVLQHSAKHVVQHVVKVHADVGGNAARFLVFAFPALQIPAAA